MKRNLVTHGDRIIYRLIGISSGVIGSIFSGLERIITKPPQSHEGRQLTQNSMSYVESFQNILHNYGGAMMWLSHYINGDGSDRVIDKRSPYYNDWIERINKCLERAVWRECPEFDHSAEPKCDIYARKEIALRILQKGLQYRGNASLRGGLYAMIGNATIYLRDGNLESTDYYDFEKADMSTPIPRPLRQVFRLLALMSPMLTRGLSERRTAIFDSYFSEMGGKEFKTVCVGDLKDLNRYRWGF